MLWLLVAIFAAVVAVYGGIKAVCDFRERKWVWAVAGLCVAVGPPIALGIMAQLMYDYRHQP
jgi:hypothetical protein